MAQSASPTLADQVSNRAKKEPPSGVNFYTFALGSATHARVQRYLDDLDKLEISSEQRDRMLETMKTVYKLILGTFDEAYNLCTLAVEKLWR
eukprot:Skav205758  [mRNA]  locus=scaffold1714:157548:157823:- [translate_table: standard]